MKRILKWLLLVVAPAVFVAALMSSQSSTAMSPTFIYGTMAAIYIWFQTLVLVVFEIFKDELGYVGKTLDKSGLHLERRVEELERKLMEIEQ